MSFNHITIIGRITKDISLQYSTSGTAYVRNSIAVDRKGKEKKTDFFSITAFGKTAEFIDKYFSKGSKIAISGHLQSDSYTDKNGNKKESVSIIIDEVDFCDSKKESNDGFLEVTTAEELPFE